MVCNGMFGFFMGDGRYCIQIKPGKCILFRLFKCHRNKKEIIQHVSVKGL